MTTQLPETDPDLMRLRAQLEGYDAAEVWLRHDPAATDGSSVEWSLWSRAWDMRYAVQEAIWDAEDKISEETR